MNKLLPLFLCILCSPLIYGQSNNLTDDPGTGNIHTIPGFGENVGLGTTTPDKLLHLFRDPDLNQYPTIRFEYCLPEDGQSGPPGGGGGQESDGEGCAGSVWDIYNNNSLTFEVDEDGYVFALNNLGSAFIPKGYLKIGQASGFSPSGINKLLITEGRIMVGQEGVSGQLFSNLERNDLKFNRSAMSYISQMGNGQLGFVTNGDYNNIRMVIDETGNVGIGTTSPDYELDVCGTIRSGHVKVENISGWCDYVFADDYRLPRLSEVEAFIAQNRHLPEIPSEEEVLANGVDLGEMNKALLKKVEELTLYLIEMEKRIKELEAGR